MNQFLVVIIAHLLAVVSPGPDFILVSRQAFLYGRIPAIFTSIGISLGILFHITYCILGLGYILSEFESLLFFLKVSCSIYLAYLGFLSIFTKTHSNKIISNKTNLRKRVFISNYKSFKIGFITNILNIKATFFFISLYSFILNSDSDLSLPYQLAYGIWMIFITGFWFILVSLFLTNSVFEKAIQKYYFLINKIMGVVLIYISIKLVIN